MNTKIPSSAQTVSKKTHRADRWSDLPMTMKTELLSFHHAAVARLATCWGWHPGLLDEHIEAAVLLVLSGYPPPGWPPLLPPIEITLQAVARPETIAATERWMVDPNQYDLGTTAFEHILADRLARLPFPHDGAILMLATSATHQHMLARTTIPVSVGIPRPMPMTPREQTRYAELLAKRGNQQDQNMIKMMGRVPDIEFAVASVMEATKGMNFPPPQRQRAPQQVTPEVAELVRAGSRWLVDRFVPQVPVTQPQRPPEHHRPRRQRPLGRGKFDAWRSEE